jgi:hypothetical protein
MIISNIGYETMVWYTDEALSTKYLLEERLSIAGNRKSYKFKLTGCLNILIQKAYQDIRGICNTAKENKLLPSTIL